MIIGSIPALSPQAHRRVDQLTFPALLLSAAAMARSDPRAGSVVLMTAVVEGTAHLITDYPPAVLPWISFRTHNQWACAHGLLVAGLSVALPGLSRRDRWALRVLAAMPILLATVSDLRPSGPRPDPSAPPARPRLRASRP